MHETTTTITIYILTVSSGIWGNHSQYPSLPKTWKKLEKKLGTVTGDAA
jgi:hypothetical protein